MVLGVDRAPRIRECAASVGVLGGIGAHRFLFSRADSIYCGSYRTPLSAPEVRFPATHRRSLCRLA